MWSSASSNELRMSLPITAVGPLKVETNPILVESAAARGFSSARTVAPASQNAVLILLPLLTIKVCRSQMPCPARRALLAAFSVFKPLLLMAFVREIFGLRQARPSVSLNAGGGLKIMHHNSYKARMARIIVLIGTLPDSCS